MTKSACPSFQERQTVLTAERRRKMARSPDAYVRGSTRKFYEWLGEASGRDLPQGPPLWICGDCHLGNLGPVASAEGRIDVQIRDLDQTVIGNPAHDLIRLALSLSMSARGADLPGVVTAKMLEEMMAGYETAVCGTGVGKPDKQPKSIKAVLRRANRRGWSQLARERIGDTRPTIPLGHRFWPLEGAEREEITALFKSAAVQHMVTALRSRDDDAVVEVLDAAYWMKGCSSLGRLRYAVLVAVASKGSSESEGYCLIDVKEAAHAAAPRAAVDAEMPRDNAKRVVAGARALSPFLGDRMQPARMLGRGVVLRELMPQDLKLEVGRLTQDEATLAARYLAAVLGKAHGRQLDEQLRQAWCDELGRQWRRGLNAPHWLWTSVVELDSIHEAAYLEHCRRYALPAAA